MGAIMLSMTVSAEVRRPAVAGAFYPGAAAELRDEVLSLLPKSGGEGGRVRAVIVPHAGYVFSGATAGRAFAGVAGETLRRVVLIGPSHHAGFSGAALPRPGVSAFATPLGDVPVDREAVEALRRLPGFDGPAAAHGPEHCLEVELPFLQATAGAVPIVPVLVGHATDQDAIDGIARGLATVVDDGTLVVVSSDFTHHGAAYGYAPFPADARTGDTLRALAASTAGRAAAGDSRGFRHQIEASGDTVCGERPIRVLLELVDHAFEGTGRVVGVSTSGEVSRDWGQVVAYAAVSFSGRWTPWRDDGTAAQPAPLDAAQQEAVTALARAALQTHVTHRGQLAEWFAAHRVEGPLTAPAGVFVTVNNRPERARRMGRLRGCIGTLEAREPLVDAVVRAAVSAAHDPRFPALAADELDGVTVEVSVLSPMRTVPDPEAIVLGTHGVLLTKGGRQAVFLPQVATETGWDVATFLSQLSRKAGLPADAWRRGATLEVFTAQVFGEAE